MNLATILAALPVIGPLVNAAPEVKALVSEAIGALHPKDQASAKAALAALQQENDLGHARLQDKLNAASRS